MVGNTGTLMSMRLVRSKLRKREESTTTTTTPGSPTTTPTITIETITQSATVNNNNNNHHHNNVGNGVLLDASRRASTANGRLCGNGHVAERRVEFNITERPEREVTFVRTSGAQVAPTAANNLQNNSWVFPPKAPTPHIYNCMNDVLLSSANEKNGFKGFRKQFSGRFKRLVSKKNEPAPAIPPELKPQLKTIYVY